MRHSTVSLLVFACGLFVSSAHAQGLTVSSGSGTISGSGTAFAPGSTYTYSDGASAASTSYNSLEAVGDQIIVAQGGSLGSLTLQNVYFEHGYTIAPVATISGGALSEISVTGNYDAGDAGRPAPNYDTCNIRGGTFGTLAAADYGGYDIYGTDLKLTSANYVTGFLSNGTAIDALYTDSDGNGFLNLYNSPAAVPEASTMMSLACYWL